MGFVADKTYLVFCLYNYDIQTQYCPFQLASAANKAVYPRTSTFHNKTATSDEIATLNDVLNAAMLKATVLVGVELLN